MAKKPRSQSTTGATTVTENTTPENLDTTEQQDNGQQLPGDTAITATTGETLAAPEGAVELLDARTQAEPEQGQTESESESDAAPDPVLEEDAPVAPAAPAVQFALDKIEEDDKAEEVEEVDHPFITIVKQYIVDMHPAKPQTPITLARYQQNFFAMLTGLINRSEYHEFAAPFSKFLEIVATDKSGVFGEHHFHRGRENINVSREERRAMQRLFTMIMLVADYKGRAEIVRNSNMDYFLEFGLSERGANNLRQFLNIS